MHDGSLRCAFRADARTGGEHVPAPVNVYVMPLRFKLGGRPVLSAYLHVETAGSERKRPES